MSEKKLTNEINPAVNYSSLSLSQNNLSILSSMIKALSGNIYWKDKEGKYLGCNDAMLEMIGIESIVGKSDFDMPWAETAQILRNNDLKVMTQNSPMEFEEKTTTIVKGDVWLSRKMPLFDDQGKVIGIIGLSLDITERKAMEELQKAKDKAESELRLIKQTHLIEQQYREKLERLQLENTVHKTRLEAQEHFTKIAQQVAHDIRSPLGSLLMIADACGAIPERERIALRAVNARINDIANNLLAQYKLEPSKTSFAEEEKSPILLSATLLQLLTEKKFQYHNYPIEFHFEFVNSGSFAFISIESSSFKRMLSNLINNAVEACTDHKGVIGIKIDASNEWVTIFITDNGKGMSPALTDKIMNNMMVTEGKVDGNGIGLTQVRETISRNVGTLSIQSNLGQGTEIKLEFFRVKAPLWFVEELRFGRQDIIVILDDDHSMHAAWDSRFELILKQAPDIKIYHFETGQEGLDFIKTLTIDEKKRTRLLTDFDLFNQKLNGLDVVEHANLSGSILVTSYYEDPEIQQQASALDAKILPKQLASEIPLIVF